MGVLKAVEKVADSLGHHADRWEGLPRETVRRQLTRAVDTMAPNIAKAYSRMPHAEKTHFLY